MEVFNLFFRWPTDFSGGGIGVKVNELRCFQVLSRKALLFEPKASCNATVDRNDDSPKDLKPRLFGSFLS